MGIGCMHSLGARVDKLELSKMSNNVLESLESKVERFEGKVENDKKKVREYIDNRLVHMPKA